MNEQTNWEEDFDERFEGLTEDEEHDIKQFISQTLKELIEDIPNPKMTGAWINQQGLENIRQQLREKYLGANTEDCDCDLDRPMTQGEAEIAEGLGKYLHSSLNTKKDN